MKTPEEIRQIPGLLIMEEGEDGGMGVYRRERFSKPLRIVWSNGGGWDHVSVSKPTKCPTWEEMCEVKRAFFDAEETVIEYHPPESEYVNNHPYCLHMWKPQAYVIPTPPSWMVGIKEGSETAGRGASAGMGL